MKQTITANIIKKYVSDKTKEGKEFKDKNGKKFWKVAIKTDKTGEDWYSALAFRPDQPEYQLEEGKEYELIVWELNGFKNFSLPSKMDKLEMRLDKVEAWIRLHSKPEPTVKYPPEVEAEEDLLNHLKF